MAGSGIMGLVNRCASAGLICDGALLEKVSKKNALTMILCSML